MALDEWIELMLVQPMKQYCTAKTTMKMISLMSTNLSYIRSAKEAYTSKYGFDVHSTSKHSESDSELDQIKIAWWAMGENFFKQNTERTSVLVYDYPGRPKSQGDFLKDSHINVLGTAMATVKARFVEILSTHFPKRQNLPVH